MKKISLLLVLFACSIFFNAEARRMRMMIGAEQIGSAMPILEGKKVACLVNQTSMIGNVHLIDSLISLNVNVVKIFSPEHGFRGKADAGAKIKNDVDSKTGLPIVSLYGENKKPSTLQLKDVDVVIFDIQDVGVRFYTYISSLEYMMEACAENGKTLLILDRPNPNGFYIDGPVLKPTHKSFVGMQAIPIVHGMTVAEYAQMLNGEGWLKNKVKCKLEIISCRAYDRQMEYILPVPPSPNLKTQNAIYLYPSLCLFEGTEVSVGRGTETPFEVWGNPKYKSKYSFTPKSTEGASNPLYNNQTCYGENLFTDDHWGTRENLKGELNLSYLKKAYSLSKNTYKFFNSFFEKLVGNNDLRKQIMAKKSEKEIRASWQKDIVTFKKIRKKYLLYPDFE